MGGFFLTVLATQHLVQRAWNTIVCPTALNLSQKLDFQTKHIYVTGRNKTHKDLLLKTMEIHKNQAMLSLCPQTLKTKLETLPWVRQAHVERQLPHTLRIHLQEKECLALWQYQGVLKPIDALGEIIPCALEEIPPQTFKVVGEKARFYAPAFLQDLDRFPKLRQRCVAAVFLRTARWDLYLANGWIIKLPEKQPKEALRRFMALEKKIHVPEKDIMEVDMRFQDALILKLNQPPSFPVSTKASKPVRTGKAV